MRLHSATKNAFLNLAMESAHLFLRSSCNWQYFNGKNAQIKIFLIS